MLVCALLSARCWLLLLCLCSPRACCKQMRKGIFTFELQPRRPRVIDVQPPGPSLTAPETHVQRPWGAPPGGERSCSLGLPACPGLSCSEGSGQKGMPLLRRAGNSRWGRRAWEACISPRAGSQRNSLLEMAQTSLHDTWKILSDAG